jgi:hypothetical protein
MGYCLFLREQEGGRWKWAARHPWQSWRERYKNHHAWFDQQIERYQQKKGIKSENPRQKVIIRKKAARRRDAVDEGQTEEEQLRKSERDRDAERKRKRKRIEEQADKERKKAKKGEAGLQDSQVRAQKNSGVGGSSSEPRRTDSDEEEEESEEERKGPAGPDDYSAEIFAGEADEIVEDSENVGPEENGDTSQDNGDEHTQDSGYRAFEFLCLYFTHACITGQGLQTRPPLSRIHAPEVARSNPLASRCFPEAITESVFLCGRIHLFCRILLPSPTQTLPTNQMSSFPLNRSSS